MTFMKGYAPIVRPWLKAGLAALLVESEARVLELRAESGEESGGRTAVNPAEGPARPSANPSPSFPVPQRKAAAAQTGVPVQRGAAVLPVAVPPANVRPVPQRSASAVPPAGVAPRRQAEAAPAARPQVGRGTQSLLGAPGALPVERWPAAWLALKDRRPLPSRPLVLWTYAGLDEDLTGTPDEARRRVIVRMLTELRHPVGTHVFWPFSLAGDGLSPEASLFWSGVGLLDPRVVLLFGSDTRDALSMPKTLLPFCQERVHGRLIIQLPRPQALAGDEASFRRVQAFLARMLRFCAAR